MSENLDWQKKKVILAETENHEQDQYNEQEQFEGSNQERYSKENDPKEVSVWKTIFGTLVIIAIAWFLIAGFVNDKRYLQILGLSVLGLVVLSAIIAMFRPGRVSFWAIFYLGDLLELLVYIIALIVKIAISIAADR